ncbi:MAG: hypothetical protein IPK24_22505 [Kineosporiaceae bacterium]|nr:hypothetical protein [Kineosporiaceae bacterium]
MTPSQVPAEAVIAKLRQRVADDALTIAVQAVQIDELAARLAALEADASA